MSSITVGNWKKSVNVSGKSFHGYYVNGFSKEFPVGYVVEESSKDYRTGMYLGEFFPSWFSALEPAKQHVVNNFITWRLCGNTIKKERR